MGIEIIYLSLDKSILSAKFKKKKTLQYSMKLCPCYAQYNKMLL